MKIVNTYSHMGGEEHLSLRKADVYAEIQQVIELANHSAMFSATTQRNLDPRANLLGSLLGESFREKGWKVSYCFCYGGVNHLHNVAGLPLQEQRRYLERGGVRNPIKSCMRINLVKDRVAIQILVNKGTSTATGALWKQLLFYSGDIIDVGVEILPVKVMAEDSNGGRMMSTGVAYYEGEVYNVLRHGRASPPVPLFIIGIAP